jgi:LPXTG-motif cell wall-anchored protein
MRNKVLETLEQNKDAAENGGYTYILTNVGPDGKETVLFSNDKVGGESGTTTEDLEGLLQATNATGEYFFVQTLAAGESAKTKLHILFDGETEVNDYMDTEGALMVSYAVEKDNSSDTDKTTKKKKSSGDKNPPTLKRVNTGDQNRMLFLVGIVAVSLLLLILAYYFWRREQVKEEGEDV